MKTPDVAELNIEQVDNINISKYFQSQDLSIKMDKVKNVSLDSLQIDKLNVKMENVGFVVLAGHAKNATFDVEKAEEVDIKQLEADTLSIKISKVKTYLGEGRKDIFSNGNGLMKLNKIKAKEKKG
ncbi:MAG: DUF2807 domain-containing protein [Bacteroidales bacterium]|nr:DUF2807 domain-containing protein [Bacteroidales bacterium]